MAPTKQENAEALTIDQLRGFADEKGIDLTGLTHKGDIVEAIVAGASADDLATVASQSSEDTTATEDTRAANADVSDARVPEGAVPRITAGMTEEEKADAHVSPADLEVPGGVPTGARITKKVNAEVPTLGQVEASEGTQAAPAATTVIVEDGEGNKRTHELAADDAARLSSTLVAGEAHPAHQGAGHFTNPNLTIEMTEEEKQANEDRYAERTS